MGIYYSYVIHNTDEALLGLLTQFDFESFEENEDNITGYIHADILTEELKNDIASVIALFASQYEIIEIQPQNWNEVWESSFQPVVVGDFCQVRADFHPAQANIAYDLIINPKMAFGTGHHATTYMMINAMSSVDFTDKKVFDFGGGTGILAILASKLGAKTIDAIDIEEESYLNTIENCQVNHVTNVTSLCGDLAQAPDAQYDVILANINRNILVRYDKELSAKLNEGGYLLISGVLQEDKSIVTSAFEDAGLSSTQSQDREGWICATFTKK